MTDEAIELAGERGEVELAGEVAGCGGHVAAEGGEVGDEFAAGLEEPLAKRGEAGGAVERGGLAAGATDLACLGFGEASQELSAREAEGKDIEKAGAKGTGEECFARCFADEDTGVTTLGEGLEGFPRLGGVVVVDEDELIEGEVGGVGGEGVGRLSDEASVGEVGEDAIASGLGMPEEGDGGSVGGRSARREVAGLGKVWVFAATRHPCPLFDERQEAIRGLTPRGSARGCKGMRNGAGKMRVEGGGEKS